MTEKYVSENIAYYSIRKKIQLFELFNFKRNYYAKKCVFTTKPEFTKNKF